MDDRVNIRHSIRVFVRKNYRSLEVNVIYFSDSLGLKACPSLWSKDECGFSMHQFHAISSNTKKEIFLYIYFKREDTFPSRLLLMAGIGNVSWTHPYLYQSRVRRMRLPELLQTQPSLKLTYLYKTEFYRSWQAMIHKSVPTSWLLYYLKAKNGVHIF